MVADKYPDIDAEIKSGDNLYNPTGDNIYLKAEGLQKKPKKVTAVEATNEDNDNKSDEDDDMQVDENENINPDVTNIVIDDDAVPGNKRKLKVDTTKKRKKNNKNQLSYTLHNLSVCNYQIYYELTNDLVCTYVINIEVQVVFNMMN